MSLNHPEIGHELKASDLSPCTVVVMHREPKPPVTVWYVNTAEDMAVFYMGEIRLHLMLVIRPDGTLVDDTGRQVHIYKYLGEV